MTLLADLNGLVGTNEIAYAVDNQTMDVECAHNHVALWRLQSWDPSYLSMNSPLFSASQ